MLVAMVTVHSTNVVVWITLKIHGLVEVVNITSVIALWIAMVQDPSALPIPNSVLSMVVMHTLHLIHSICAMAVSI